MTKSDVLSCVPGLMEQADEPIGDSSYIATSIVVAAKRQVTVCLSGDGGDELFSGYTRYWYFDDWWRRFAVLPLPIRRMLAAIAGRPAGAIISLINNIIPSAFRTKSLMMRIEKFAALLSSKMQSSFT